MKVELTEQEWQLVLNVLGDAPWKIANPLLMKIAGQLRGQAESAAMSTREKGEQAPMAQPTPPRKGDGADKEVRDEQ